MNQSNTDYIKVDSIDEIDPNKLSLSFVGKKFIDRDNNRFSIRFNRETRKMEVVKIMIKSGGKIQSETGLRAWEGSREMDHPPTTQHDPIEKEQVQEVTHKPIEKPHSPSPEQHQEKLPKPSEEPKGKAISKKSDSADWNFSGIDLNISTESLNVSSENLDSNKPTEQDRIDSIQTTVEHKQVEDKWKLKNERDKIDELMKSIEECKDRINSVLINIKSSRIFEITGDPSENQNIMGNLTREFDVEVFQSLDKTSNYHKELVSFPRAISYYTAKYEKSKREELRLAEGEKDKLHLIIRWELQEAFTSILEKFKALTLSLLDVMNLKNESHVKQLQYPNQLMFTDAKNATVFCSQDIDKLIKEVEDWKYNTSEGTDGSK